MRYIRTFVWLIFFISSFSSVQSAIPVGMWRTHFSYQQVDQVETAADGLIYAVANGKLFSVGKDQQVETYSKLTGLNGLAITYMAWNETEKSLMIVYED
jgi:hypothetical protein